MPSFLNDENTPIESHNSGVVCLDSRHHNGVPHKDRVIAAPKSLTTTSTRTTNTATPSNTTPNDSFDEASSVSDDSSFTTTRARMNGSSTMTPLPNGRSTKTHNGVAPTYNDGLAREQSGFSRPTQQFQKKSSSTERISTEQRASTENGSIVNGASSARQSFQQQFNVGDQQALRNDDGLPRNSSSASMPSSTNPDGHMRQPQRFSSPAQPPSAASSSLQPGASTVRQRHTLEVPKAPPMAGSARGSISKEGGHDAAYASGRYSPTVGPSGRRASLNLGRRNTRSIHSELHRDEVIPDDEASRWAEAYRQKRARRKRREEEDDDKVLVGTKVDENHANWTNAYNMLTGIRVSVSRTNAKLDRPLTDADFEAKQKSTFDITGNELVPSAKYDFKFKDYAPWVFRHLRALFKLDPADYLMSLTGKYILSELGSPGKSGSFFYFSRDYKYIIKTIHHAEHKFLRKILKEYYTHVTDNPNTLLSQFYGLHRVKMPYGRKIHFVVMNNLFPPHRDIHSTFDLKGSTIGRDYKEEELERNPRATLKDLNWLRRKRHLELGLQRKQMFMQQLQRDVRLMQKLGIMDYSLLIGIHDLQKGNEENLRGKTLQVFSPGGEASSDDPNSVLMRTPSKMESARKARELRQMIQSERPKPVGESSTMMPDALDEGHNRGLFYTDDGGLRATHEDNTPGDEIYYLGVIDCLTHYGLIKKMEHFWKGLTSDRTQISALPPTDYGERFIKFMSGITMSPEEAERDARDRAAAAATASAGEKPLPAPTYLPPAPPGMRDPRAPEPNTVVERALETATRSEQDLAREEHVPERKITTSAPPGRTNSNPVLPVVEETAEASSIGGRDGRPFTPTHRTDGYTDLGPHNIGGRGPPTPPKTSYLDPVVGRNRSGSAGSKVLDRHSLDKALPPLPQ